MSLAPLDSESISMTKYSKIIAIIIVIPDERVRLRYRNVLIALRGAYGFAPAQAATCVAAKTARVPHGPKATCIHGRLRLRLRRSGICSTLFWNRAKS